MPYTDKPDSIGTLATAPASGSVVVLANNVQWPFFNLTFALTGARVPVTDAGAGGSYGALKLFDFNESAIVIEATRSDFTKFAEGAALTGGAGDASFVLGVGTAAVAAAADGNLTGTTQNVVAKTAAITLAGGTAASGTLIGSTPVGIDGTAGKTGLYLNFSGTAATIDANSTLDVTGTITIAGKFVGDD